MRSTPNPLKAIFKLSKMDIVERSRYDLSFKFSLEVAPGDLHTEPRSLNNFDNYPKKI